MNDALDLDNIVVFDGICNFCSAAVRFIVRRDHKVRFRFVPMQSDLGEKLLVNYNFDPTDVQTFLLIKNGVAFDRTNAALEIVKAFPWFWQSLRILRLLPKPFRDWFYNLLAKYRYQWFGKKDRCMIPDADIRNRFLDHRPNQD